MNELGILLRDEHHYEESEAVHREALKGGRAVFGEDHPNTLTYMSNLGATLMNLGDYEEAIGLFEFAYKTRREFLGAENRDTIIDMNNLAAALEKFAEYEKAEALFREALELTTKVFGAEHPDAIFRMNNLASFLLNRDKPEEARRLTDRVMKIAPEIPGLGQDRLVFYRAVHGRCLAMQGEYEPAEEDLLAVYERLRERWGEGDWKTQKILEYLIYLYEEWEKPAKAEKYREKLTE